MSMNKGLLGLAIAAVFLAGCKKPEEAAAEATASPEPASASAEQSHAAEAPPAVEAAPAKAFDINSVALSEQPLGDWPYVQLPAGYQMEDTIANRTKDLARVPVWTGGQLLWLEGKVFTARVGADTGKTYSRFELNKGIEQSLQALGAHKLADKSFDETLHQANREQLQEFVREFDVVYDAYWYDNPAQTWVIRRADKMIWVVTYNDNSRGSLMVVEAPLPETPAQP